MAATKAERSARLLESVAMFDARTSEALMQQLADVRAAVTALGDASAALDTGVSPQMARSVQATVNLLRSVEHKWGMYSPAEAGKLLGSSSERASRNLALTWHKRGQLLAVTYRSGNRYPGFQFDRSGDVVNAVPKLRALAEEHQWSERDLFYWLVTPRSRLDGAVPADLLSSDEGQEQVLTAAELEMNVEW